MTKQLDFRYALDAVTNCRMRIRRKSWPDHVFLFLHKGTDRKQYNFHRHMFGGLIDPTTPTFISSIYEISVEPFLCIKDNDGHFVPWSASSADLLAGDWSVVE